MVPSQGPHLDPSWHLLDPIWWVPPLWVHGVYPYIQPLRPKRCGEWYSEYVHVHTWNVGMMRGLLWWWVGSHTEYSGGQTIWYPAGYLVVPIWTPHEGPYPLPILGVYPMV